tara:strand:- start:10378 stop:11466 length:1089 start_codon:yes stop_codon:yes gene_type:complete
MKSFFIRSSSLSGAEKRVLKINFALNQSGEVYFLLLNRKLFSLIENSEYKRFLVNSLVYDDFSLIEKILLRIVLSPKLRIKIHFSRVNAIIKKNKIDLVHIFLSIDGGRFIKAKKIYEITSPDYVKKIKKEGKDFQNGIEVFHAVSESTFVNASLFIPTEKLVLAPIPFFFPNISTELINSYNIKDKEQVILFAHRLIPRKNGRLFAEVANEFLTSKPDWKIKIYGDGPDKELILEILSDKIEEGSAEVGFIANILPELAKSKIFVSLISPDNYPSQSVLESMFMENALLISDTGHSCKMFLKQNGIDCQLDKADILKKLEQLVSEDLEVKGKESKKILERRFDKRLYLNHLKSLHKEVLEN